MMTTSFPRYINDSPGKIIYDLSRLLTKNGIKIGVIAPHARGLKKHEYMDDIEVFRFKYMPDEKSEKIAYSAGIMHNMRSFATLIQIPFFMAAFVLKAFKIHSGYDIFHAHWVPSAIPALLLKLVYKKPVVLTVRGSDIRNIHNFFLAELAVGYILRKVDLVISIAPELTALLKKYEGIKLIEIHNPLDETKYSPTVNLHNFRQEFGLKKEKIISFIGRLVDFKDPLIVVKAADEVLKKYPDIKFFFVGGGDLKKNIETTAEKLGIRDKIVITGWRRDIDIIAAASDIFLAVSQIENIWSNSLLQAMASETACIVTDAGLTKKKLEHKKDAYIIPAGDKYALADAIVLLLEDSRLRDKIAKNGRIFLKENAFFQGAVIPLILAQYRRIWGKYRK